MTKLNNLLSVILKIIGMILGFMSILMITGIMTPMIFLMFYLLFKSTQEWIVPFSMTFRIGLFGFLNIMWITITVLLYKEQKHKNK